MEATTEGSDALKAIVSAISTLVEEATFVANPEGITFRGMDPSHVALIDVQWPSTAFEQYECTEETQFGVRIDEFAKVIKRAGRTDTIKLGISDKNMLLIDIGNKKYKLRLIEGEAVNNPLPKSEFTQTVLMAPKKFLDGLADVSVISKYLTITGSADGIHFSGTGDSGEVKIQVDAEGEGDSDAVSGTYDLEYISSVARAVGSATDAVKCEYSDSKPLRIEFRIADTGIIHFYLAPRVEPSNTYTP